MKPAPFEYRAPDTLDEALDVLAEFEDEASVLAGGQSLVPLLNLRLVRPTVLLDVNRIAGLDGIRVDPEAVRAGALVRARTLERHAGVAQALPVLPLALSHVGHPQIRNRTTVGGNVAHADPSSELPSVLAALDGTVRLAARTGHRQVGWSDFFETVFTTCREPGELVVGVDFPRPAGMRFTFREMARRHGDFPIVGACVGLRLRGRVIEELRVALSGVADRPTRLAACEEFAAGREVTPELLTDLAERVREVVAAHDDIHGSAQYRRALAAVLVRRAVAELIAEHSTVEGER